MRKIPLTIEALSPLVLTAGSQGAILTESGDAISGSIVRGMIAARFIEAQNLGRAAHESEAFRRLFAGALKFSAAYPSKGGESAMRLPLSLQKDKISSASPTSQRRTARRSRATSRSRAAASCAARQSSAWRRRRTSRST